MYLTNTFKEFYHIRGICPNSLASIEASKAHDVHWTKVNYNMMMAGGYTAESNEFSADEKGMVGAMKQVCEQ